MAEKNPKITIDKPSTHKPGQPMSLTGTAPPGTSVEVKPKWERAQVSVMAKMTTRARDDGKWSMANVQAPETTGVFEIEVEETQSVESTPATTTTTFAVKGPRK